MANIYKMRETWAHAGLLADKTTEPSSQVERGAYVGLRAPAAFDLNVEDAYWRENYRKRPYVESDGSYEDYGPAYKLGVVSARQYEGHAFEDAEAEMARRWGENDGGSTLGWEEVRDAARDAWNRVNRGR